MSQLKLQPTTIAQWYALVCEAELHCGHHIDESLENYLVLTLDSYTTQGGLASVIIAFDYLAGTQQTNHQSKIILRDVGDQCLILSGLFPDRAKKKNVSLDYFINLGKQAYHTLAGHPSHLHINHELFYKLGRSFVDLMEVLQSMREQDALKI